jgi:hypothetical protein
MVVIAERVCCSSCGRTVESDVLDADQLLRLLCWGRIDGRLLCVSCRQDTGRSAELSARMLTRA